jgi:type VI secretion system protein ImpM
VLGPESGSRAAALGVMAPSSDRVGRAFPFFLVARLPGYRAPTRALCGEREWFDAAERLLRRALAPDADLQQLDRNLASLPPLAASKVVPRDLPSEPDRSFWWTEDRRLESRRFASSGLPAPESFGRFIGLADDARPEQAEAPKVELQPVIRPVRRAGARPVMRGAAASHPGTRLRINADRFSDPANAHIQALADGTADGPASAQAAELVVDRLRRVQQGDSLNDMIADTKGALGSANTLLRAGAIDQEPPSAAVVVLLSGVNSFAAVWAGDARLYLLREGLMRLLTRDHVEVGLRRRLSRSVGGAAQFSCDTLTDALQTGDRFLLVTAPLVRIVPERLMAQRLAELEIEQVAKALIEDALVAGAAENISAFATAVGAEAAR